MLTIEFLYSLYRANPVVTTDSRNCPEKSIFIALKGENFNGNRFAKQALDLGCSYAVVDEIDAVTDERILLVEDCLKTLQNLASYHRHQCKIPVIAITGTNGKTTTKELMAAVLSKKYKVLYTQGNLNNHIGVPLTLLRLNTNHDIAVIEMGANHPGEIKELVQIVDPDYGLITNVGKAHLEGFGSFEGVIKTKGELYDYLRTKDGKIFINMENPYLKNIAKDLHPIKYATQPGYELWGETISCSPFLKLRWFTDYSDTSNEAQTNLIGSYNLENAVAAICVGREFKVGNDLIRQALEEYVPSNNRSQLKQTGQNTVIIDAYNANPTSMAAALKNFQSYDASQKVVILGSMKELGSQSEEEHRKLSLRIAESNFDHVFLIGSEFYLTYSDYPIFKNVESFTDYLKEHPLQGYTILIKGSRGHQLESIVPFL